MKSEDIMGRNDKDWKDRYSSQIKYDDANTVRKNIKLNKKTDADILEAMDNAPSTQGLIKDAIRFYLAHKK